MKVLVLSYLFPNSEAPGYGVFVLNRLRAVAKHCEMVVIAPLQWYPFKRWLRGGGEALAQERVANIQVHHPKFAVIPRYFKAIDGLTFSLAVRRILRAVGRYGRRFDFDVIDLHWTYPDIIAGQRLSEETGRPYIVTIRGHEALYDGQPDWRRIAVEKGLRGASAIVAVSDELRDRLVEIGVPPSRIRVIHNGVDTEQFHPREKTASRCRLNLPVRGKVLVSVGRLSEAKGHQDLIQALGMITPEILCDLYIIGGVNPEEDYGPELQALVTALGLGERVHFVPNVRHSELPDWYSAADLFCLASWREGCPNVVLEALACGTPAVVSRVGAVPQMIEPGKTGYLVPIRDPDAISSALREGLGQAWSAEQIAMSVRDWSWERCGERVLQLYEDVRRHP
jgi:teichuronic acid biosynthesis glycosyltransferase TuaC